MGYRGRDMVRDVGCRERSRIQAGSGIQSWDEGRNVGSWMGSRMQEQECGIQGPGYGQGCGMQSWDAGRGVGYRTGRRIQTGIWDS